MLTSCFVGNNAVSGLSFGAVRRPDTLGTLPNVIREYCKLLEATTCTGHGLKSPITRHSVA